MRFHTKRKHMIDYLFPIALFFVFALSALTVLLLAARIYQSTTENSSLNYTSRTSLSYISEKIHQNDMDGKVTIGSFDGCDALIMEQNIFMQITKSLRNFLLRTGSQQKLLPDGRFWKFRISP